MLTGREGYGLQTNLITESGIVYVVQLMPALKLNNAGHHGLLQSNKMLNYAEPHHEAHRRASNALRENYSASILYRGRYLRA